MKRNKLWSCLLSTAIITAALSPLCEASFPPDSRGMNIENNIVKVAATASPTPTAKAPAKAAVKATAKPTVQTTVIPIKVSAELPTAESEPKETAVPLAKPDKKPDGEPEVQPTMMPPMQMPEDTENKPEDKAEPTAAPTEIPEKTAEPTVVPTAEPEVPAETAPVETAPIEKVSPTEPAADTTATETPAVSESPITKVTDAPVEETTTDAPTETATATPEAVTDAPTEVPTENPTAEPLAEETEAPLPTVAPDTVIRTTTLDLTQTVSLSGDADTVSLDDGSYYSVDEGWTWYGESYSGTAYEKNTLVLDDTNIKTVSGGYAVRLPDNATLVINGDNTINAADSQSTSVYGIYANGDLTVKGDGTMTVTATDSAVKVKASSITLTDTTVVGSKDYNVTSGLTSAVASYDGSSTQYELRSTGDVCKTVRFTASVAAASEGTTSTKVNRIKSYKRSQRSSHNYLITFDVNGGDKLSSAYMHSGQQLGTLTKPKRTGYVFAGWYLDADCTEAVLYQTLVSGNMTLYAKWVAAGTDLSTVESTVSAITQGTTNQFILTIGKFQASVWGDIEVSDVAPIIVNERTMLPARFVAENLGADVSWSQENQKVTITKDDTLIEIYIGADTAYINGSPYILDSPAFVSEGTDRTYTPVRFVAEALGANVDWDGDNQQVIISLDD